MFDVVTSCFSLFKLEAISTTGLVVTCGGQFSVQIICSSMEDKIIRVLFYWGFHTVLHVLYLCAGKGLHINITFCKIVSTFPTCLLIELSFSKCYRSPFVFSNGDICDVYFFFFLLLDFYCTNDWSRGVLSTCFIPVSVTISQTGITFPVHH